MLRSFMAALLAVGLAASPVAAERGGKGGGRGRGQEKHRQGMTRGHGHGSRVAVRHQGRGPVHRRSVVAHRVRGGPDRTVVVTRRSARTSRRSDRVVVFADRERDVVRTYFVETYGRGNCPPGLAKKNNGCLPPGQARKAYVIGQPLPRTVVFSPPPPVLVTRLGPPPVGYQYVVVDGDVLKLAIGTRLVVDAVRLMFD